MGSLEFYLIVVPVFKNLNESECSLASITNNSIFLSACNKALINGKRFESSKAQPLANIGKISRTG